MCKIKLIAHKFKRVFGHESSELRSIESRSAIMQAREVAELYAHKN